MTEPEELDEDLFADLYDGDDASARPVQPAAPVSTAADTVASPPDTTKTVKQDSFQGEYMGSVPSREDQDNAMNDSSWSADRSAGFDNWSGGQAMPSISDDNYGPIGIKEDG